MGAITAQDVAVTLLAADNYNPPGQPNVSFPSITFGGEGMTYPALGVPLPSIGKFGMKKEIKRLYIQQPADGYVYVYDPTNYTIRIFQGSAVTGTISANSAGTPAGNVTANFTGNAANHAHDLLVKGGLTIDANDAIGLDANSQFGKASANDITVPGANAATKGGVLAANVTPEGTVTADFVGAALANHSHTLSGGAAGALSELGTGAAVAARTLLLEVRGQ